MKQGVVQKSAAELFRKAFGSLGVAVHICPSSIEEAERILSSRTKQKARGEELSGKSACLKV